MSEFRGSFFRQAQTDYCARISEPPQKRGFDEHNPPGSFFREDQTLHLYGTLRPSYVRSEPESAVESPLAPQTETPREIENAPVYQASEMLSFDLSNITSRRLCVMGARRLLQRAIEIGDTDGISHKDLRTYAKGTKSTLAQFERAIKPKGLFGSFRERLFDD